MSIKRRCGYSTRGAGRSEANSEAVAVAVAVAAPQSAAQANIAAERMKIPPATDASGKRPVAQSPTGTANVSISLSTAQATLMCVSPGTTRPRTS